MNPVFLSGTLDWLSFAACAAALSLACYVLLVQKPGMWAGRLAAWLTLAGMVQAANGLALWTTNNPIFWCRLALVGKLLQPACLLWLLLPSMQSGTHTVLPHAARAARWRTGAAALAGAFLGMIAWFWPNLLDAPGDGSYGVVLINSPARALYSFILIGLVLGLAQIEQLLRALSDQARYQLKFILLGLGALAAYEVYDASQVLLMGGFRIGWAWVGAFTAIVTVGMAGFGLRRVGAGQSGGSIYISPQVAYGSLTFLFIGLYLLAAGLLGEWVNYTGTSVTEGLRVLVLFFAVLVLAVLAASRTVRTRARQFISRNFYRSPYDYRAKWLEVTEAFRMTHSTEAILDQTLSLLSRTFGAPRLSIWMRSDADGRFIQVRSVNIEMPTQTFQDSHPFLSRLANSDDPIELGDLTPSGPEFEDLLVVSRAVLAVPIRSGDRLIAFLLLGGERAQAAYGVDDCDLLKAIAHHVGVLLSHAKLAEERRAAAEVEAVNHLAAFCVHDLKNLAARLSLVVQNAQTHGQDPGFQASAMRTISTTVEKMLTLIAKLAPRSRKSTAREEGEAEIVNVGDVIAECVAALPETPGVRVRVSGDQIPAVRFGREQLGQVLTNLVLNARQAVGTQGDILIETMQQNHDIVISIIDDGPGIPAERLPNIFRPFQTSKPGGLGLGLYQCRHIVQTYRGSLNLESELGRGTTVRIILPVVAMPTHA